MYIIPRKTWLLFNHVWPLLAERALSARHVYIESVVEVYLDAATASISTTFDATPLLHQLGVKNLFSNQQLPPSCLRSFVCAVERSISYAHVCIYSKHGPMFKRGEEWFHAQKRRYQRYVQFLPLEVN
jgi:hypothetical protein